MQLIPSFRSPAVLAASMAVFGLAAVPSYAQEILQPTGVTTTMRGFAASPAISMIDQSGLRANYQSGVTDFDSFVASTTHANSNPASIVTVFEVGGIITVDLGASLAIDAVHLWGLRTFATSLTGFTLFADFDGDFANGTSSSMGAFAATIGQSGTTFSFPPVVTRFVHFEVTANGGSNVVKVGEAAFRSAGSLPFTATVPSGAPASGTPNGVPFGAASPTSSRADVRYQTLVTRSQLGSRPRTLTGLRFVPAGTGVRRFQRLIVRFGHTSANSLTDTFDTNLAPGTGTTVLDLSDHVWHHTANTFNDIGLQDLFAYNGQDNLIVEIVTAGSEFAADGSGPTSSSFRRGALPRLFVDDHDGSQTTGTLDNGGQRMQFHFGDASTGRFGEGCAGTQGVAPSLSFTGDPLIGGSFGVDLSDGSQSAPAALVIGLSNRLPTDLGLLGAPGCLLYHDIVLTLPASTDGGGAASIPLSLRPDLAPVTRFYSQWLVLDAGANLLGVTTSNYGRVAAGF